MAIKRIIAFLMIIVLLGIFSVFYPTIQTSLGISGNSAQTQYPLESATLLRVIDGDTIEIDEGAHIRMLGINTPEKKMPFSNESKNFLKQFEGKQITLERDWEDTDKYKRKLRYIFYESRFLNQEILELGLANSYYTSNLKYEQQLLNAENQAKTLQIGIWTKSNSNCVNCIKLDELNAEQEYFTILNQCGFNCNLEGWFVKDAGRNTISLSNLPAESEQTYASPNKKDIWNNNGDRLFIFDDKGLLVLFFSY